MKTEIKRNITIWILLVLLICTSTIFSENGYKYSFLIIIGLSVVKFLSVIFQFVEVKHAHPVWKLTSLLFVIIYFFGVLILF